MSWNILNGDCLEVMRTMEANSIDCIVTDPPYGLHFMGKDWDKFKKSNFDEKCDYKKVPENGKDRTVRKIYTANSVAGSYDERRNDEFEEFVYHFGIEALRIVKPGGHILMFGAPRRYHRQVCGLEDAGWEIRDCLMWIFGQGFPKSHNHFGMPGYGTALKPAYEPIIMAMKPCEGTFKQNAEKWGVAGININACRIPLLTGQRPCDIISEKEVVWELEKCLCPSCANAVVSRMKPEIQVIGEYFAIRDVEQILKEKGNLHLSDINSKVIGSFFGLFQAEQNINPTENTNLNISKSGKIILAQNQKVSLSITLTEMDLTIVSKTCNLCDQAIMPAYISVNIKIMKNEKQNMQKEQENVALGARWPANLLLDEEAAQMLDQQSGNTKSSNHIKHNNGKNKERFGKFNPCNSTSPIDSGGASRFFYCAKASSSERNAGLDGMPLKECGMMEDDNYPIKTGSGNLRDTKRQNFHPTVKPLALMQYLIKLVMPPNPNAILLDPFAGSGTTILASKQLNRNAIGIELSSEYAEIATQRIESYKIPLEQYELAL